MASEADSERFCDAVRVKVKGEEGNYVMIDATRLRFLEAQSVA
jgi:hypothetical protein